MLQVENVNELFFVLMLTKLQRSCGFVLLSDFQPFHYLYYFQFLSLPHLV